jgi:hypothetical protein
VTVALGFEEPQTPMLIFFAILAGAAPAGVAVHLAGTRELSVAQKRAWLRALASRRGFALFASYLNPRERAEATHKLQEHSNGRAMG